MIFSRTVPRIVGLSLVLLLSACGPGEEQHAAVPKPPEKIIPVKIENVSFVDVTEEFTLPATLEAVEDLTLAAEIAGPVEQLQVKEGDRVDQDAVLLEIDAESIRSVLRRERENVRILERKVSRYQRLEGEGLVSRQELEDLENALTAARTALRDAELRLAKSTPRAPVSGIIDRVHIDRGEYVDPGQPLVQLVQVERLQALADVPEKDVASLSVGQQVRLTAARIDAEDPHTTTGRIDHIAFTANPVTRTYRTKILLDNHDGRFRPGMILRARFVRQEHPRVITVPLFAVVDRQGDKRVFVVEKGRARAVEVRLGRTVNQRIIIRDGLSPGQQVIVSGQQLVLDGSRVNIQEP